jgi:hypothetical protein
MWGRRATGLSQPLMAAFVGTLSGFYLWQEPLKNYWEKKNAQLEDKTQQESPPSKE